MDPHLFFTIALGLFGLLFGSFANVVIWRVPRGESIVEPGSHCPSCDTPIAWYDNVPVLSWLVLRAKCRACGEAISARYPLIEASSGILFAVAAAAFGVGVQAVLAAFYFWFLLVLTAIDLDCMRLPNPIVAALAVLGAIGVSYSTVLGRPGVPLVGLGGQGLLAQPWAAATLGVVIGAGLSGAIAGIYGALRGKTGLGMGDIKLLGALGIFLGPYVLLSLFIASVFGAVFGILSSGKSRLSEVRIPFGPWLAFGGVMTAVTGPAIVGWYLRLVGLA